MDLLLDKKSRFTYGTSLAPFSLMKISPYVLEKFRSYRFNVLLTHLQRPKVKAEGLLIVNVVETTSKQVSVASVLN